MRIFILYLFIFILFCCCRTAIYTPSKVNTGGLRQVKELKGNISITPQTSTQHLNYAASIAYAPANRLLLLASFDKTDFAPANEHIYNDSNVNEADKIETTISGHNISLGAGYFKCLKNNYTIEVIGGINNGSINCPGGKPQSFTLNPAEFAFNARYNKLFAQVGYGAEHKNLAMMFGARQTFVKYYGFNSINPNLKYTLLADKRADITKHVYGFFEPYFEGSAGWKQLRFTVNISMPIQVIGLTTSEHWQLPNMGLGISYYYLPHMKKKADSDKEHQ